MQEELKVCPWCGVKPNISHDGSFVLTDGMKWGALRCCGTGPEVRTGYMDVAHWKGAAIAAWNERAPVSGEVAEIPVQTGIDHAKLEDDRAAFESRHRMANGATDETFERFAGSHYSRGRTCDMWAAWQARGKQTGGNEKGGAQ